MLKENITWRSVLCLFGLIMVLQISYAQTPISSLFSKLKHSAADTNRVNIYKQIVTHYRGEKPDSATIFALQGLNLSTQLNFNYGIAWMNWQLGVAEVTLGKMDTARRHLTNALNIFNQIKDQQGIVITNNSLGVCLAKQGLYKEATGHFLTALKINQANNNTQGLVQSYLKLGVLNEQINNLDKALTYFNSALELNKHLPPSNMESTILNNVGIIYAKKNQMQPALKYFLEGIKKTDNHDPELSTMLLLNAGGAYQQLGNIKTAFEYENNALKLVRKNHLVEAECNILVNLASLKSATKPDSSLMLLKQALAITQQIHQHHVRLDVYQGMIDAYKQKGDFKNAVKTLEIRNDLKDSLFTLKNSKDIAGMQANYDLAQSQLKVQQLKLINQQNKFQNWIILAVAIGALVVLAVFIMYYEKTRKLNTQLLQQQQELTSLNTFKDKLFSIIGHDLRSPVATIVSLLGAFEGDENSAENIQSFIPRLKEQSLSTLDVMDKLLLWGSTQLKGIRNNQTYFNAKEILIKSLNLHHEAAEQKNITLVDNTPDSIMITADYSHVDFIIRNLLANAIKYTRTGGKVELAVNIGEPAGYTTFIIKDNGVGIDKSLQQIIFDPGNESMEGTDSEKGNSIGLMLCKEFVERNDGKIWVESELGKGTDFYVSFNQ